MDELAFSVKWFVCRTFKRGVALVHVTKLPSKLNDVRFKKSIVRSCNMSCDFFARLTIWSANTI